MDDVENPIAVGAILGAVATQFADEDLREKDDDLASIDTDAETCPRIEAWTLTRVAAAVVGPRIAPPMLTCASIIMLTAGVWFL